MKLFEGKTPAERNKLMAAIVLGALSFLVLMYVFVLPMFSSKKTIAQTSPTPKPSATPKNDSADNSMPNMAEEEFVYSTTPVFYVSPPSAPDAGRNIFAFYEPPPPTPYSPTPTITPKPTEFPTPTPAPPPPFALFGVSASGGSVIYAGQNGFIMEISGDRFTPEAQVTVNGAAVPTTFHSPQRLTAEIPSSYLANPGNLFITIIANGGLYSNQLAFTVQPKPLPQFKYIGYNLRSGNNNNTAYIKETDSSPQKPVRLNEDVGRFKVISISRENLRVKDNFLGFEHIVPIEKPTSQGGTTPPNTRGNNPTMNNPTINNPTINNNPSVNVNPNCPPGIPCDRFPPANTNQFPQQQRRQQPQTKDDYDDDGDN